MKKLLLIFLLSLNPLIVLAEIDECKTDIYFANGILTEDWQAKDYAILLEDSIIETFGFAHNTDNHYDYTDAMKYFVKGFSEPNHNCNSLHVKPLHIRKGA